MKLKFQKLAVQAGKFVFEAIIDKLVLALGGLIVGAAYKGLNKFREKRALKKAEKAAEKTVDSVESKTDEVPAETEEFVFPEDVVEKTEEPSEN